MELGRRLASCAVYSSVFRKIAGSLDFGGDILYGLHGLVAQRGCQGSDGLRSTSSPT